MPAGSVAIVDYGMGNVFSVAQACEHVGLKPIITADPDELSRNDAVVLPGVGAFGTAMQALDESGMSGALRDFIASGRQFVGVCLGIQLLMEGSEEFGEHTGLNLIPGKAQRLLPVLNEVVPSKVPQMQWNRIWCANDSAWRDGLLKTAKSGEYFYFVHSYHVTVESADVVIATTRYAGVEFPSVIQKDNIFACQFHPERSGPQGLAIYHNLAAELRRSRVAVA